MQPDTHTYISKYLRRNNTCEMQWDLGSQIQSPTCDEPTQPGNNIWSLLFHTRDGSCAAYCIFNCEISIIATSVLKPNSARWIDSVRILLHRIKQSNIIQVKRQGQPTSHKKPGQPTSHRRSTSREIYNKTAHAINAIRVLVDWQRVY